MYQYVHFEDIFIKSLQETSEIDVIILILERDAARLSNLSKATLFVGVGLLLVSFSDIVITAFLK